MPFPEAPPAAGFATGPLTLEALATRGVTLAGWQWAYRVDIRRDHPFHDHRVLAGQVFAELPTPSGWWPGDHRGCLCDAVPKLRDTGTGRFAMVNG